MYVSKSVTPFRILEFKYMTMVNQITVNCYSLHHLKQLFIFSPFSVKILRKQKLNNIGLCLLYCSNNLELGVP